MIVKETYNEETPMIDSKYITIVVENIEYDLSVKNGRLEIRKDGKRGEDSQLVSFAGSGVNCLGIR